MNTFKLSLIVIFAFALGCNKDIQTYRIAEYETHDSIKIAGGNGNTVYQLFAQKTDTSHVLYAYDNTNKIAIFDLGSKQITTKIPLSNIPLLGFHYQSEDSIFVLYNPSHKPKYKHDSVLMRINTAGDTLDVYSFAETPATCSENPGKLPDSVFYVSSYLQRLKYADGKIFLLFRKYSTENAGDSSFYKVDFPKAGHIDIATGTFVPHKGIEYPFFKPGHYYPNAYMQMYIEIGHNGNPLYSFSHTPLIYEYDINTNEIIEHYVQSTFVDSIKPIINKDDVREYPLLQPDYQQIYYDKYNNRYERHIRLPSVQYEGWPRPVVFFDTAFNIMGEGMHQWGMLAHSGGYTYSQDFRSTTDDSIAFVLYSANFKSSTKEKILSLVTKKEPVKFHKGKIELYLRDELKIKDTAYTAIVLPQMSCPSCVNTALRFYSGNMEYMLNNSVYLILAFENRRTIDQYLAIYDIDAETKNIIIDEDDKYLQFHDKERFNPRIVFVENREVIHDKVYNPDEMREMQIKILEHIDGKAEYKEIP